MIILKDMNERIDKRKNKIDIYCKNYFISILLRNITISIKTSKYLIIKSPYIHALLSNKSKI